MQRLIVVIFILGLISCSESNIPIDDNSDNSILDNKEVLIVTDTVYVEEDIFSPKTQNGFYGFVLEYKGDFMPGTDIPGTIDSVQLDVYVYEKLTFDSIKNAAVDRSYLFWYIDSIKQTPLAIIKTNNMGFYEIELQSGEYTGLIKLDDDRFYINLYTGDGHVGPMILTNDLLINYNFRVDYEMSI